MLPLWGSWHGEAVTERAKKLNLMTMLICVVFQYRHYHHSTLHLESQQLFIEKQ